jgi:multidrug efflux pump
VSISAPFIQRPVATTLIVVAIALGGIVGFTKLEVAALPQVDSPTINVNASLPGASPEIMASSVATPLERQLGRIAGVTEMTSSSYLGSTSISLVFDLDRNIDGAARDVQAAINAARSYLPSNLPSNPTYRKVNPADKPIVEFALTSDVYDAAAMYDSASTIIQQKLSQIEGVGQVSVNGGSLPAVRVEINPTQLNSYGLGLADVQSMLSSQNANIPKGQLSSDSRTVDILANDQLLKAADYRPLIVGYHKGAAVRLSDIADVEDSVQDVRNIAYFRDKRCISVQVQRQPGANIVQTVQRIKDTIPSLQASIPAGIKLWLTRNRTITILASIHEIEVNLMIAIGLVILVVFVFLRSPALTLIPMVAVPVSLLGTCGMMYLLNYSIDNLSLMAMTISTGFVVDDAIVVIENIARHVERGMKPMEAALHGTREIGSTLVSMTTALVAVFTPLLLMTGLVGRLFREFAVTLSITVVISLFVSLTMTSVMCSRLLKQKTGAERQGRIGRLNEQAFNSLQRAYGRSLQWVLRHEGLTLVVLLLTIALNGYLIWLVPKGFFPLQDNGSIRGGMRAAQDTSFQAMREMSFRFLKIIEADPSIETVVVSTGGGGPLNGGNVNIQLVPLEKRKLSASQVIDRLRPKLAAIPGSRVILAAGQDLQIGGRMTNAQYQYTLQGDQVDDLVKWGPLLVSKMRQMPGLTDVDSDQQNSGLQMRLVYDRRTASRMGITPQLLDSTLYSAFGQSQASTMYKSLNQYYVILEVAPEFWQSPLGLNSIYVHPVTGGEVPLGAVAHFEPRIAPLAVNHQGQFPSVTVSFNLAPNVSLSEATRSIDQLSQSLGMPESIHGIYSGTMEAFQDSLSAEPFLIATALIAVYIVLGMLYESYIHPITILSTLPSAGVGAMLALILFHMDLNVLALIGMILLIGLVKKNAILMIDFALGAQRNEGKDAKSAIYEACMLRFRPIMMTRMAALLGALPLALSTSIGAELRQPLGYTIIGGLIVSQALTLFTTPVVYLYMDRLGRVGQTAPGQLQVAGQEASD